MSERALSVAAGVCAVLAAGLLLVPDAKPAGALSGYVETVVDGDTLRLPGQRVVRLWGIDAPEMAQPGGRDAWRALYRMIEADRWVRCEIVDRDRYGRTVASCANSGGDLGRRLVAAGHALDYARYSGGRYETEQRAARASRLGMWRDGEPVSPTVWRREHSR